MEYINIAITLCIAFNSRVTEFNANSVAILKNLMLLSVLAKFYVSTESHHKNKTIHKRVSIKICDSLQVRSFLPQ